MPDFSLSAPAYDSKTPVLNDTTDATSLASGPCVALITDAAGDIKVTTLGGTAQTFTLEAGAILPVRCRRIWSTGTTVAVSAIHALYPTP